MTQADSIQLNLGNLPPKLKPQDMKTSQSVSTWWSTEGVGFCAHVHIAVPKDSIAHQP